ncbi:peptidoglycan recognition protein family protein [Shinella sp. G-2]|uniref:peptidoglycan recognition protein family protein n=1 Tax=Shinella sp. G-2 TaxID=3133141 RepID=UPI003CFC8A5A
MGLPRSSLLLLALLATVSSAGAAEVMSRSEWGARKPVLAMEKQTPRRITVHHTATRGKHGFSIVKKMTSLQAFSQARSKLADGRTKEAWADIPYHFYIAVDGKIAEGRPIGFVGDTNTKYDPTGHVTIVVEGNFEKETPTAEELAALKDLIRDLSRQYGIPADRIGTHKDFAQTACPGKNLEGEVRRIAAELAANR